MQQVEWLVSPRCKLRDVPVGNPLKPGEPSTEEYVRGGTGRMTKRIRDTPELESQKST